MGTGKIGRASEGFCAQTGSIDNLRGIYPGLSYWFVFFGSLLITFFAALTVTDAKENWARNFEISLYSNNSRMT